MTKLDNLIAEKRAEKTESYRRRLATSGWRQVTPLKFEPREELGKCFTAMVFYKTTTKDTILSLRELLKEKKISELSDNKVPFILEQVELVDTGVPFTGNPKLFSKPDGFIDPDKAYVKNLSCTVKYLLAGVTKKAILADPFLIGALKESSAEPELVTSSSNRMMFGLDISKSVT
jgi:hypothetical protein